MRSRHWRTSKASGAGVRSPTTGNFRVTCCRGGTRGGLAVSLSYVCAIVVLYPVFPAKLAGQPAVRSTRAQHLALALHANAFAEMRHRTLTAHGRGRLAAILTQCHQ